MRPLVIAVLLLSCAGDEARRSPQPQVARPGAAPSTMPGFAPAVAHSARESAAPSADRVELAVRPAAVEDVPSAERVAAPAAPAASPSPPADPRAATRQAAHDALAANCGECHEGHRSHAPKALAVFDLDLPDWPARFNEHRFASALRRLQQKSEAASAAFIAFRDAERAAPAAAD